jgi:hypothetical protein
MPYAFLQAAAKKGQEIVKEITSLPPLPSKV